MLAVPFLTLALSIFVHDPQHRPEINDWLQGLHSKHGEPCCNEKDVMPAEAEYDMDTGKYRVRLKYPDTGDSEWYEVPDNAIVMPNKLGYAVVWYYWKTEVDGTHHPEIRCFLPGGGT